MDKTLIAIMIASVLVRVAIIELDPPEPIKYKKHDYKRTRTSAKYIV